jgi:hypothetical protein
MAGFRLRGFEQPLNCGKIARRYVSFMVSNAPADVLPEE